MGLHENSTTDTGNHPSPPKVDQCSSDAEWAEADGHTGGSRNSKTTSSTRSRSKSRRSPSSLHSQPDAATYNSEFPHGFKIWEADQPHRYPVPKKEDPWDECFKLVLKFDEEMCRGWREEIDTLLVFAGLFSAAVTAFTIESYKWLQPNPLDVHTKLLQSISSQLQNLNNTNTLQTQLASPTTFTPAASSVRVNIFWFTSLTLSLIAVLLGILCKQWLREYQRYEGLSAKDAFPVRHLRYEGLQGWHVPTILSTLPLLLQAALILFFGGLLDLLWTIDTHVAVVVSSIIGIAMVLLIGTTVAPCIQNLIHLSKLWPSHHREPNAQCAFKSPQSWAFYILVTSLISTYSRFKQFLLFGNGTALNYLQLQLNSWLAKDANWVKYDYRWQMHGRFIQRGVNWFDTTFARGHHNVDAIHNIYHCLASLDAHISAESVAMIIRDNWNPLVTLVGLVQPVLSSFYGTPSEEDMDVDPGFAQDMILASFLVVHHKTSRSVSSHCLERCTRMLNSPSLTKELSTVILETLKIVVSGSAPSEQLAAQLMVSLSTVFRSNLINIEDVATFWMVVTQLIIKVDSASLSSSSSSHLPSHSSSPLHKIQPLAQKTPSQSLTLRSLQIILKHAHSWLSNLLSSPHVSILDKQTSVRGCSAGVVDLYRYAVLKIQAPAVPFSVSTDVNMDDVDGDRGVGVGVGGERRMGLRSAIRHLEPFVLLIDGFIEEVGGPELILVWGEVEAWNSLKGEFGVFDADEVGNGLGNENGLDVDKV